MFTLSSKETVTITATSSTKTTEKTESTKDGAKSSSFADLLSGFKLNPKDSLNPEDATLVLDLKGDDKLSLKDLKSKENILSLLKGETTAPKEEDLALNKDLTVTLSLKDLKQLVSDAKQYLKDKINLSDGAKEAQIKDLPQTLKGLAKIAEKYDIDVSKLTMQSVKATPDTSDELIKNPLSTEEKLSTLTQQTDKTNKSKKSLSDILQNTKIVEDTNTEKQSKISTKEIKDMPLFKAQTKTTVSAQDSANVKSTNISSLETLLTPKKKADDTLKALLKGEKAVNKEMTGLTADFSVATAKVINAPKTDISKNLEYLLNGETSDKSSSEDTKQTTSIKSDITNIPKSDSLEVKMNEAKQMTKYLSQDVKTAIDNYKAPFTRVKVQLNPQNLGEVDLTIVQRGKNLHINLSSNNTAINALAMNANDLKVQLQNNGINNASLNFNNNPQGQDGSAAQQQQQQNHQRQQHASKEYNYFDANEENEEILSSLEIVVPNYA